MKKNVEKTAPLKQEKESPINANNKHELSTYTNARFGFSINSFTFSYLKDKSKIYDSIAKQIEKNFKTPAVDSMKSNISFYISTTEY